MSLELVAAAAIALALAVYAVTGGADFGGGIWTLFAAGPRKRAQRELVENAIGPIWEANHVWLIVVVVLSFVCFPRAFYVFCIALHVPLVLLLVGIVLRGSAFVFRAYGLEGAAEATRWERVFAIASAFTPVLLGITLGTIATGEVTVDSNGRVGTDALFAWLRPFPLLTGGLAFACVTFLAAIYLVVEADDEALRRDFRIRAALAALATLVSAVAALLAAHTSAPTFFLGLTGTTRGQGVLALTTMTGVGALLALLTKRDRVARAFGAAHVFVLVLGFAIALAPFLVPPSLTIMNSAASPAVLRSTLAVLGAGTVLLIPALFYLYRVFKTR